MVSYRPLAPSESKGAYCLYWLVMRLQTSLEAQAEPCTTLKADEVEGQDVVHAKMEL